MIFSLLNDRTKHENKTQESTKDLEMNPAYSVWPDWLQAKNPKEGVCL